MKNLIKIIPALLLLINCAGSSEALSQIYFRFNQLGFLPAEPKSAVILSKSNLASAAAEIVDAVNGRTVLKINLEKIDGGYAGFTNVYRIDFSEIRSDGSYYIKLGGNRSGTFAVQSNIFRGLADSLLTFFKVQRCGYTNPLLHSTCHIADATSIIDGKNRIDKKADLTGGWHDAGDYVKFLNTTAVASYTLLFAYDFDPVKFGFDNNKDGVPDILEEAKVGLDWMLRCYYSPFKFVTQVQDLRDHDQGWRLPENDPLQFDRPAFIGMGKNLIGIYSAALALASRIWREKIKYNEFADKCIDVAQSVYTIRSKVPDIDSSGTGQYIDNEFKGKLALGAYELFAATKRREYLMQSMEYAEQAGSDFWWSWGNINSFAHYRLAQIDRKFLTYIEKNLERFRSNSEKNPFELGAEAAWGANNTYLGIALQSILWKRITFDGKFDCVAAAHRDYILGRNPWGISFISGFGTNYVQSLHHQVSHLKGVSLPGGFAAGPVKKEILSNYKIPYEKKDTYSIFQTGDFYYRDDKADYITNEPTIVGNATAIFVFGFYAK